MHLDKKLCYQDKKSGIATLYLEIRGVDIHEHIAS